MSNESVSYTHLHSLLELFFTNTRNFYNFNHQVCKMVKKTLPDFSDFLFRLLRKRISQIIVNNLFPVPGKIKNQNIKQIREKIKGF